MVYSQANHINELRAMLDDAIIEQRKLIRDRGYYITAVSED